MTARRIAPENTAGDSDEPFYFHGIRPLYYNL